MPPKNIAGKYFIYAIAFIVGGVIFLSFSKFDVSSLSLSGNSYNKNILESSTAIWNDKKELFSYVKKFGPKKTVEQLHELGTQGFGDCHQNAHTAGRFAYEINNDKAFQLCSAECHSGCYHGATEAYFKENGTANLGENLKTICNSELNPFFSHQCVHGIGHGLMAWTDYDLPEALKSCDLLSLRKDSCWTGVFMENIVGGLAKEDAEKSNDPDAAAHFTKYLSDDPLYPCNDPNLDAQYKNSCYFLQTSRMMQLYPGDFKRIGSNCLKVPAEYQRTCFESMGRDVGGFYPNNPTSAIKACLNAPKGTMRIGCLIGAAQDSFWDPSGQNAALNFCKLLTDQSEKTACYTIIFERAPQVLTVKEELENFCAEVEQSFQSLCLSKTQS